MPGNFGNEYKIIKLRRGLRANLPTLEAGEMGFCEDTRELAVGSADGTNVMFVTEVNSGGPVVVGSLSSPETVDPALGLTSISAAKDQTHAITGRVGMGGELVTAAVQVAGAPTFGQIVRLIGSSDVDFPIFQNGNGLRLQGEWRAMLDSMLTLMSLGEGLGYIEVSRNT